MILVLLQKFPLIHLRVALPLHIHFCQSQLFFERELTLPMEAHDRALLQPPFLVLTSLLALSPTSPLLAPRNANAFSPAVPSLRLPRPSVKRPLSPSNDNESEIGDNSFASLADDAATLLGDLKRDSDSNGCSHMALNAEGSGNFADDCDYSDSDFAGSPLPPPALPPPSSRSATSTSVRSSRGGGGGGRGSNSTRGAKRMKTAKAHDGRSTAHRMRAAVGTSCHQCKSRRSVSELYFCSKSWDKKDSKSRKCLKKFCGTCLQKFYPVCWLFFPFFVCFALFHSSLSPSSPFRVIFFALLFLIGLVRVAGLCPLHFVDRLSSSSFRFPFFLLSRIVACWGSPCLLPFPSPCLCFLFVHTEASVYVLLASVQIKAEMMMASPVMMKNIWLPPPPPLILLDLPLQHLLLHLVFILIIRLVQVALPLVPHIFPNNNMILLSLSLIIFVNGDNQQNFLVMKQDLMMTMMTIKKKHRAALLTLQQEWVVGLRHVELQRSQRRLSRQLPFEVMLRMRMRMRMMIVCLTHENLFHLQHHQQDHYQHRHTPPATAAVAQVVAVFQADCLSLLLVDLFLLFHPPRPRLLPHLHLHPLPQLLLWFDLLDMHLLSLPQHCLSLSQSHPPPLLNHSLNRKHSNLPHIPPAKLSIILLPCPLFICLLLLSVVSFHLLLISPLYLAQLLILLPSIFLG